MDPILLLFLFGIYGVIVLILAIIWDKIILRFIKKPDYTKSSEEFLQNLKKLANNECLVIKDYGCLKLLISDYLIILLFFILGVLLDLEPITDNSRKEIARINGLVIALIGVFYMIWQLFFMLKNQKKFITNFEIYKNKLEYSFMNQAKAIQHNSCELNLLNSAKVTYGYIPVFENKIEKEKINLLSDDRYGKYVFFPLFFCVKLLRHFIFFILNLFKIKKYAIVKTDSYIFSILLENELLKISKNLKFNTKTLII